MLLPHSNICYSIFKMTAIKIHQHSAGGWKHISMNIISSSKIPNQCQQTLEPQNSIYFSKLALSQFLLEGELVSGELSHGWIGASKEIHVDSCDGVGAAVWRLLEADDVCLCIVGGAVWTTGCRGSRGGAWSWCGTHKCTHYSNYSYGKTSTVFIVLLSYQGLQWTEQIQVVSG